MERQPSPKPAGVRRLDSRDRDWRPWERSRIERWGLKPKRPCAEVADPDRDQDQPGLDAEQG